MSAPYSPSERTSPEPSALSHRFVVLTAPSGAGKTTIARRLLAALPGLRFSVSATTRPPRDGEVDGRDYHFVSPERFQAMIEAGELIEWQEVYAGRYYGTPRAELARDGRALLLDIDVKGARNIKRLYGRDVLTLFVAPPSLAALEARLRARGTETEETLHARLGRARAEMELADDFDHVVVNDDLDVAVAETLALVTAYLNA